jgi:hypothetical protein
MQHPNDRRRWLALVVLCLGDLMIVLDSTIVNVAPQESGLASGVVDTAFMMGGALGLASLAASRTDRRRVRGRTQSRPQP